MRKILYISAFFILFLGSCSLKEPDLSSNISITYPTTKNPLKVASIYTLSYKLGYSQSPFRFSDINPDTGGIQDEIIVNFNAPFTLSDSEATIKAVSGKDSGVISFSYVVRSYEKQIRFILNNIKDSTTYELHLFSSRIKDLSGNPLDGNNNGIPDSSYDDFITYFRGPLPDADIPDNSPFSVQYWYFSNYVDEDALSHDTLYIVFSSDIDTATVDGNFALYSYPLGEDHTDKIVEWHKIGSNTLYFVYDNLPTGASYAFVLKDGLKDKEGRGFDGNDNGILELNDTAVIYFNIAISDSLKLEYPKVQGITSQEYGFIISFTKPMDINSISDTTLIVFDSNDNRVNARLSLYPDKIHLYVEPLLPLSTGKIFLSRKLKDTMGLEFDGNENGYGGEPGKDDIFLSF